MLLALFLALAPQRPISPILYPQIDQDVQIPVTLPNGQPDVAEFWLMWYPSGGSTPRPLVVGFHGYSSSEASVFLNSKLDLECNKKGWLLLAPLGRFDVDHGTEFAQVHVEAAIDYVIANHPVDTQRIYAVGFSSGGGFGLSYAARHQDLGKPRIAAVVNHTGVVSQRAAYDHATDCMCCDSSGNDRRSNYRAVIGSQFLSLSQFCVTWGGPPTYHFSTAQTPFHYQHSSAIDLVESGGQWFETSAPPMYLNLVHLPVHTFYDPADLTGALVPHNEAFISAMTAAGANHTVTQIWNGGAHEWDSLPYPWMMTWLASQSLGVPPIETHIDTAIDRDGKFYYFDVVQQQPQVLSWLRWHLRLPSTVGQPNSMNFAFGHGSINVDSVAFDWQQAGLDDDQLKVQLGPEVSASLLREVTLPNYVSPLNVDIFQESGAGGATWQWNPYGNGLGDLVLKRGDATYHSFVVDVP